MTPSPRVSVLMLTYNRPQYISRAIESVLAQRFENWELLVVQDGGNQEIQRILREWTAREPRIRYFHRETVGNIAEANNYGLQQARGEYIAILDDDDYWSTPDKLRKQVAFFDTHPEYVGCAGGVIVIDQNGAEQMRIVKPESDERIKRQALYANPLRHTTAMFRRVAGGRPVQYDETLSGFQDWDLWLKLGKSGKLYNFPEYFTYYQVWEGGGTFHQQKGNTSSAVRIVWRHRAAYRGFLGAFALVLLYWSYARLPFAIRRFSYTSMARLKRTLFSNRPVAQGAAGKC
jgi:glycosyltransferase involved in cell wall biosynthesis